MIVGGGLAGLILFRELGKLKQYRVIIVEPSVRLKGSHVSRVLG